MPPRKGRKGKQAASKTVEPKPAPVARANDDTPVAAAVETSKPTENEPPKEPSLVLTSDKRRGVYECDYCHADISQVPRIRCAVCPDFDLCLSCFSSADHAAAIASLKALQDATDAKAPDHNDTHGYRVADSTRYVLFPASSAVVPSRPPSCVDGEEGQQQSQGEAGNNEEKESTKGEEITMESAVLKDVAMEDAVTDAGTQDTESGLDSEDIVMKDSATDSEAQDKSETESERDTESVLVVQEDPRCTWTVEEDLRLLDAIKTCGLGNWADIAETVGGQGSSNNKTPRRCMQRYLDDFLGRYGHILPPYTVTEYDEEDDVALGQTESGGKDEGGTEDGSSRPLKRRRSFTRTYSTVSIMSQTSGGKKKRLVATSSLPGAQEAWPDPYIPPIPNVECGQEVGRVARARAEQAFVKETMQAQSKEEADKIRAEWEATRLNKADGPTALPMRADDIRSLKGAELAGYMPRRGDFDMEWDNEAETVLADMEFTSSDSPQDRQLKIQIIEMYNAKLDERERRKQFLLSRGLVDYRKNQKADEELPRDERDLVRRMRLFERLHTPEEHAKFISDILKAKRLRKEIAKLQMYRRMGITSLAEAEKFELDKSRREFHKHAYMQKEAEAAAKLEAASASAAGDGSSFAGVTESSSYWKEYRTTRGRRSINRGQENDPTVVKETGPVAQGEYEAQGATNKDLVQGQNLTETTPPGHGEKKNSSPLVGSPGYELLSTKEIALCEKVGLTPSQYLEVKSALIQEALAKGVLDKATSNRRTLVKIDVEKKGQVVDFMVRAGWIASKPQRPSAIPSTTTSGS